MKRPKVEIWDIRQTTTALSVVGRDVKKAARRGVRRHLEAVGTASLKQVPWKTGHLASSQVIEDREMPHPHGWIDYTASYAVPVHEIPAPPAKSFPGERSARHKSPRKWRYLADPFAAEEKNYLPRVQREIEKALREARRLRKGR